MQYLVCVCFLRDYLYMHVGKVSIHLRVFMCMWCVWMCNYVCVCLCLCVCFVCKPLPSSAVVVLYV